MEYKVLEGDTLAKIAQKMGVLERDILRENHLEKAKDVEPGRVITIPQPYIGFLRRGFEELG